MSDATTKTAQVGRWLGDDERFRSELAKGHTYARHVAHLLMERGLTVQLPPSRFRSHVSERGQWSQDVDLWVGRECRDGHDHVGPGRLPIEVKSRDLAFTSAADYKYPTAFVDTKSGYEKKQRKPSATILVSRPTGGLLVIRKTTQPLWTEKDGFDHKRQIPDVWLHCPKSALQPFEGFVNDIVAYLGECRA